MSSLWLGLVARVPCVACAQTGIESPSVCHHMRDNQLGKRQDDRLSIALCPLHHVGEVSIHNRRKDFERQFGSELELHAATLAGIESILKARGFRP